MEAPSVIDGAWAPTPVGETRIVWSLAPADHAVLVISVPRPSESAAART